MAVSVSRVVLDTNVVLSALVFGRGPVATLRSAWQAGEITPLVSRETAEELIRVLAYPKFKLNAADQQELLADYLPFASAVKMPPDLPSTPDCRDPYDLPFLHLALVGEADFLVTGDRDLLVLAEVFACPILTLEQFLAKLSV